MAVNMGCENLQPIIDALKRQLAAISARRDELERWYSEHVAATAQLRDDLAAMHETNLENERIIKRYVSEQNDLIKQLDAANARIAKALDLWYEEIQDMIRPDSDDLAQNLHDAKQLMNFVDLLSGKEGERYNAG